MDGAWPAARAAAASTDVASDMARLPSSLPFNQAWRADGAGPTAAFRPIRVQRTEHERRILEFAAQSLTDREIAATMVLAEH
jgi:hypothetical protein